VRYQHDPVRTLETAVLGTLNLLELARDPGARISISSTSEIYGEPLYHPRREEHWGNVNPIGKARLQMTRAAVARPRQAARPLARLALFE
jgi:nucleoside-diphosphate-sugar epimerase